MAVPSSFEPVREISKPTAEGAPVGPGGQPHWRRDYARRLFVSDAVVLAGALLIAVVATSGFNLRAATDGGLRIPYWVLSVALGASWMLVLQWFGTRDVRVIGDGAQEYHRIMNSTMMMFGWVAIAALMLKIDLSRSYLAVAFPLGLLFLLADRKGWRVWLRGRRARGHGITKVLVLGGVEAASEIARTFHKLSGIGIQVTGVLVPDPNAGANDRFDVDDRVVPVFHGAGALTDALELSDASMVIVTDSERMGHRGLKDLMWRLSGSEIELMVSPNVMDVSNARLHLTAVASMPFLHVDEPKYAQADSWLKVVFDRILAGVLVIVLSPLLLLAAVAVKASSPGRVLYLQERVGRDGEPFQIFKFRSMSENADTQLQMLLEQAGQGAEPCAKLQEDPRVTRVGSFLRRYSIDELPQLFNVLNGQMSLVGPRPQRHFEVEMYDEIAYRRLRVRPGMTGLWQVSGRSDLTWEDAVRLDTYYVENWSMTADLFILWRTVRAVLTSAGAS